MSKCPPWFVLDNATNHCASGPQLGGIIQQDMSTLQTQIMQCNCMNKQGDALVVGTCFFQCFWPLGYYALPCNVSELNDVACAGYKRRGPLCSQCDKDHALPVYSYNMSCVKCYGYQYNWLKYLAAAYLPLTVFYVLVALFSISFTSPLLSGLVITFQIFANPVQAQLVLGYSSPPNNFLNAIPLAAFTFAALWNLDFFRIFYSFCLHPEVSAMEIRALNYGLALFPVILIFLTYVLVRLHDRNLKPLVWVWKLVSMGLRPFRQQWRLRTSLVDVFASFLYLSSSRIQFTSLLLLLPTRLYTYKLDSNGHMKLTTKLYLFDDTSQEYLSSQHLPFALLAIVLLLVFVILPMILLFVYPFTWFQTILNKTSLNSLTLRIFIELFQGNYKDSTNGTKDYRYFSGFLILFQLVMFLTFSLTQSCFYYPIATMWIVIYLCLHLVFKPYKKTVHNHIAVAMLTSLLGMYWGIAINSELIQFESYLNASIILMTVSSCIPFIYLIGLVCVIIKRRACRNSNIIQRSRFTNMNMQH